MSSNTQKKRKGTVVAEEKDIGENTAPVKKISKIKSTKAKTDLPAKEENLEMSPPVEQSQSAEEPFDNLQETTETENSDLHLDSENADSKPEKEISDFASPEPEITNEQDFNLEMIEQSMLNVAAGQVVEGKVVGVDEKEVLVDIGCKSEAAIQIHEFNTDEIPVKGDTVRVYVVSRESGDGKPVLSKRRADFINNLTRLKEVHRNDEIIVGKLTRRIRGGMIVDVLGVEAFLPGSQIAMKNVPNLDQFINKEVQLKIVKIDDNKKSIVVSRKKVLEEEFESKKEKLKEIIKINAELDGEVKNITDYGAFVDLGGLDGLLHITDMSWGKINHPAEMLNIGDKIKVKCLSFDDENSRVSIGIKQLVPHPWENIEAKFPEGTKVTGKVVNLAKYGAFVELEPGVEGLIHVSEMSWTKKITSPRQMLKKGDTVSAIVLTVSKENQRISLGMKQMQPNPWIAIEKRYPEGMVVTRKIKNLTTFGAFVEIEPDIDGLIHISDISWTKRIYHPRDVFKKGQEVNTVVLNIDKLLHRIALGLKQMHPDPWDDINENLPVNTEVVGTVIKCIPKGILVDIPYKNNFIEGFVPISHLAIPQTLKTEEAFDINEEIDMKIIEVDTDNRRLILSVKAWFFSREKQALKDYQKDHLERAAQRKEEAQKKKEKQLKKRKRRKQKDKNIENLETTENTEISENVEKKPKKRRDRSRREKREEVVEKVVDVVEQVEKKVKEVVEQVDKKVEKVVEKVDTVVEQVEKKVKDVVEKVEKKVKKIIEQVEDKPEKAKETPDKDEKPVKPKKVKETPVTEEKVAEKPVKPKKVKDTAVIEEIVAEKPVKPKKVKETPVKEEITEEKPVKPKKVKETPVKEEKTEEKPAKPKKVKEIKSE